MVLETRNYAVKIIQNPWRGGQIVQYLQRFPERYHRNTEPQYITNRGEMQHYTYGNFVFEERPPKKPGGAIAARE